MYVLELRSGQGQVVFSREIADAHVAEVARLLDEHMGSILAIKGGFQLATAVKDIIDGVGMQRRRAVRRARR